MTAGSVTTPEQSDAVATGERLTVSRLLLLACLASLGALATNIMLPAFPAMAQALGVEARELSWTLSSFFIVFAVGQLFVGPYADAMGRKPFVIGGLALFVAGSLLCAFSGSLPVLLAGRAIQALGACCASVLSRAIARDLFQGPPLTRALSLVMIAMAAAPGFSPTLGTGMTTTFGWRSTFLLVAAAGAATAVHFAMTAGETLDSSKRRPVQISNAIRGYLALASDLRFIRPALPVSLVIGCLYSFFGAAPQVLMNDFGMNSAELSIFFAATVFVVLGGGLLTAPLSRRWGTWRIGMSGIVIAVTGSLFLVLQSAHPTPFSFMSGVTLFLAGMGLINPIGTALALEPFGDRAGIASALLGFWQMGLAAIGTALIGFVPAPPVVVLGWILLSATVVAAVVFSTIAKRE